MFFAQHNFHRKEPNDLALLPRRRLPHRRHLLLYQRLHPNVEVQTGFGLHRKRMGTYVLHFSPLVASPLVATAAKKNHDHI